MGRPGGGAPQKTSSGKIKNFRIEDPQLRFQFHAPDRNMVDNDLRYRIPLKDQRAYKLELGKNILTLSTLYYIKYMNKYTIIYKL